jgi:hypothetical protein
MFPLVSSFVVEQALRRKAISLRPSEADSSRTTASFEYVRQRIVSLSINGQLPNLLAPPSIAGSLTRGTKNSPIDDIDILVPMNGRGLTPIRNGLAVGTVHGTMQPSSLLSSRYDDVFDRKSSIRVMNDLRESLRASYPRSGIGRDGQSVTVELSSYKMTIDVVPCLVVREWQQGELLWIPSGRNDPGWIATAPHVDNANFRVETASHGPGVLEAVIRLVKYWNSRQTQGQLRSYHMEVLVRQHLVGRHFNTVSSGLRDFFSQAPLLVAQSCPDPTGIGAALDLYLRAETRKAAVQNFEIARYFAWSAGAAEANGQSTEAVASWSTLFGAQL